MVLSAHSGVCTGRKTEAVGSTDKSSASASLELVDV